MFYILYFIFYITKKLARGALLINSYLFIVFNMICLTYTSFLKSGAIVNAIH